MAIEYVLTAITGLLALSANFAILLLLARLSRTEKELDALKQEVTEIRLNYLNRFQDVKDHQSRLHLEMTEKISILQTLLTEHLYTKRRKLNG